MMERTGDMASEGPDFGVFCFDDIHIQADGGNSASPFSYWSSYLNPAVTAFSFR